jgi:sugar phosphate isomerase/epimerase/DhnA family fructose-bisphosphate aldolase class Ia
LALADNVLSLVHFMAYPGPGSTRSVARGEAREEYLIRTMKKVLDDPYFGGIEVTRIKDRAVRAQVAKLLSASGKQVTFSAQSIQMQNEDGLIAPTDISSVDEVQRRLAVDRLKEYILEAYELGAWQFALVSGQDPGTEGGLRLREQARLALARSLDELCTFSAEEGQRLGRDPLVITLETFDRRPEPGFKNQLIGPAEEAIEVARMVRDVYGHKSFGLMYDLSHMPMIQGISLDPETPEVLRALAPYLNHVHLGTCVLDKEDPLRGDFHPPFGYPGGVVDSEMMGAFVKALKAIDYRGGIGFEVSPYGRDQSDSVVAEAKTWLDIARNRIDVNYCLGSYFFQTRRFFTESMFDLITQARVERPQIIEEAAAARKVRESLTKDGKLLILAADHPGRHVTNVGSSPVAMGDRLDYLGRILRVVAFGEIDGIMATSDIIEDLFIVDYLLREKGHPGLLDDLVLLGSMNRTGLAGIEYEMDDRMSSINVERMVELRMDGAKMMFRIDPGERSRQSVQTLDYCQRAINECNANSLTVFLEPLPVIRTDRGYQVDLRAEPLIKTIGVGAALGGSSQNLWLKIPYVENYDQVARATTLPLLMLGGASKGDPTFTLEAFERGMGEGANVRGAMVGRNVLYPGLDDPAAVSAGISKIIHSFLSTGEAVRYLAEARGKGMGWLREQLES